MNKHTPGPWTVGKNGDDCAPDHAIAADAMVIAKVYGRGYPIGKGWSPWSAADARLIAKAPEMRELLSQILMSADDTGCSADLTVVSAAAVESIGNLLAEIDGAEVTK